MSVKEHIQKPELLLPAGNEACLRAAVNNGADAVYLGFGMFNARRSAQNFNEKNIYVRGSIEKILSWVKEKGLSEPFLCFGELPHHQV